MQLAVITDEISQDLEHALDVMAEYGVRGAELRGLWGTNIADLSEEQTDRAISALKSRGMEVVGLATPFYKCDLKSESATEAGPLHLAKPTDLSGQMEILRRCMRLAEKFGTRNLRVFTFWKREALTPEIEKQIVEAFAEPVALAEREGFTLLLENEHACFIGTGVEAGRLAQKIDSPAFRVVWDPGNAFHAGENPFPDGYDAVKEFVTHLHLKDAKMVETEHHGRQPKFCVIGEGEIDYVGQFAALRKANYAGWLSLETHFVPTVGSGERGQGTPEDGSRLCLEVLTKMV